MRVKTVYDTNVIVSAALKPGSLPASLVALAMAKEVRLFLSNRLWQILQNLFVSQQNRS
jgi:predicted nucleic acid-binding protein